MRYACFNEPGYEVGEITLDGETEQDVLVAIVQAAAIMPLLRGEPLVLSIDEATQYLQFDEDLVISLDYVEGRKIKAFVRRTESIAAGLELPDMTEDATQKNSRRAVAIRQRGSRFILSCDNPEAVLAQAKLYLLSERFRAWLSTPRSR